MKTWENTTKNTSIKYIDKSAIKHNGCMLPKNVFEIFEIDNLEVGETRYITLICEEKKYKGRLTLEKGHMPKLCWYSDFKKRLISKFGEVCIDIENGKSIAKETRPRIMLNKRSEYEYEIGLLDANKEPVETIKTKRISRSSRVRKMTLARANGLCERCKISMKYLQVHHIIPLAEGGTDDEGNTIALCPNCHVELHHTKSL